MKTASASVPMSMKDNQRLGFLEGWLSIVINTLLFAFKYWAGTRAGSVSMTADAWHTLSDTLTSVVVIIGFWIMARPADGNHPFGHARAEGIAAIVIGVLLAVVGANFLLDSIKRLINFQAAEFSTFAIVVFLISVVLKEGLAQFSFWAGKKTGAASLKADGWHHRSDGIASALIVVGAFFGRSLWWMDGVLGIGVSLLIIWAAVSIFRESSNSLLGEAPDDGLSQRIAAAVRDVCPEAGDVHHLHIHRYGRNVELTLHVRLASEMTVGESHDISARIEKRLRDELGLTATVHVEPLPPR